MQYSIVRVRSLFAPPKTQTVFYLLLYRAIPETHDAIYYRTNSQTTTPRIPHEFATPNRDTRHWARRRKLLTARTVSLFAKPGPVFAISLPHSRTPASPKCTDGNLVNLTQSLYTISKPTPHIYSSFQAIKGLVRIEVCGLGGETKGHVLTKVRNRFSRNHPKTLGTLRGFKRSHRTTFDHIYILFPPIIVRTTCPPRSTLLLHTSCAAANLIWRYIYSVLRKLSARCV